MNISQALAGQQFLHIGAGFALFTKLQPIRFNKLRPCSLHSCRSWTKIFSSVQKSSSPSSFSDKAALIASSIFFSFLGRHQCLGCFGLRCSLLRLWMNWNFLPFTLTGPIILTLLGEAFNWLEAGMISREKQNVNLRDPGRSHQADVALPCAIIGYRGRDVRCAARWHMHKRL